jgi:uncharacterized protein YwgA
MLIARRKNKRGNINMYITNRRLEQVKGMKFLGIYFDNRHNFHKRLDNTEKMRKMIYILVKTAKINWAWDKNPLTLFTKGPYSL